MGLVIFGAIALYAAFLVATVWFAVRAAKRTGKSPWTWGIAAILVVYLLVFWDHIPTVLAHKYYCEKEAGFWIYKTVDQWKSENPGVLEALAAELKPLRQSIGDTNSYTDTTFLNQRFIWVVKTHGPFFLYRWHKEQELFDSKTQEVMARYVDFRVGYPNWPALGAPADAGLEAAKFWLASENCAGGENNAIQMTQFVKDFMGTKR